LLLKALELHSDEAILHFNLACYLSLLGVTTEARTHVRAAIDLDKRFQQVATDKGGFLLVNLPETALDLGNCSINPFQLRPLATEFLTFPRNFDPFYLNLVFLVLER
jgi:hypothetical protein